MYKRVSISLFYIILIIYNHIVMTIEILFISHVVDGIQAYLHEYIYKY